MRSKFLDPVLNGKHRTTEKHKVGGHCSGDCIAGDCVQRSAFQRQLRLIGVAVPSDDLTGVLGCSKRQSGGSADEAGAVDGYALDQITGISDLMFRFTAVAMIGSWPMSLWNSSGNSDCAPSESA